MLRAASSHCKRLIFSISAGIQMRLLGCTDQSGSHTVKYRIHLWGKLIHECSLDAAIGGPTLLASSLYWLEMLTLRLLKPGFYAGKPLLEIHLPRDEFFAIYSRRFPCQNDIRLAMASAGGGRRGFVRCWAWPPICRCLDDFLRQRLAPSKARMGCGAIQAIRHRPDYLNAMLA